MASCCGAKQGQVDYEITFKHDGSTLVVASLSDVRIKLAASPKGGTYRAVPRARKA